MPRDFPWALDLLIADCCRLMDALGVESWARQSMAGRLGSTSAAGGRRLVADLHGPYLRLDPARFHATHRLRRHAGRFATARLPDAGEGTTEGSGLPSVDDTRAW